MVELSRRIHPAGITGPGDPIVTGPELDQSEWRLPVKARFLPVNGFALLGGITDPSVDDNGYRGGRKVQVVTGTPVTVPYVPLT